MSTINEDELKARLDPLSYAVLREGATERPFTGEYTDTDKVGSYRCKACGRTFITASSPTIRHRKPHKNAAIFRLLVNKVPFRRICEIEGITMSTLYRKINFIHQQCTNFAAGRERNLPAMSIPRLYILVLTGKTI